MSDRPGPYELWRQAGGGTPTYSAEEHHRLMVEHGHFVPRPACTCTHIVNDPAEHEPACPRYQDNDRRLPCGWLPGENRQQRATFRLVRLSPAHPLWHLERVGAEQTECGRGWREPIRHTLTEPLPTPRCTTCGPRMEAALQEGSAG